MKKRKVMAAGLVTLSVLTAGLTASSAVSAAEIRKADSSVQTYKDGAVVPASKAPAVRKAWTRRLPDCCTSTRKKPGWIPR